MPLCDSNRIRIGFFDSGVGGLILAIDVATSLKKFLQRVYNEYGYIIEFIHIGDTVNIPYGDKSAHQIVQLTKQLIHLLNKKSCDIIVAACNTILSTAYNFNNDIFDKIAILSLIDDTVMAVYKEARRQKLGRNKEVHIGLLATKNTINSGIYQKKLTELHVKHCNDEDLILHVHAPQSWVTNIENGLGLTHDAIIQVEQDIDILVKNDACKNINTICLACTHYQFYQKIIIDKMKKLAYNETLIPSQGEILSRKIMLKVKDIINRKHSTRIYNTSKIVQKTNITSILTDNNIKIVQNLVEYMYNTEIAKSIYYIVNNELN